MLSIFPAFFTYKLLAPFILRIILGIVFLELGYLKLGKEKKAWHDFFETIHLKPSYTFVTIMALIEIAAGCLILVGYMTQVAALVMSVILFAETYIEFRDGTLLKRDIVFYLLTLAICLSLLFSGAGFHAGEFVLFRDCGISTVRPVLGPADFYVSVGNRPGFRRNL